MAETINLNTGFGVLACENEGNKCTMPAQFAQSIEIILNKAPGNDYSSGSREFRQEKNGHLFTGTMQVTKYTVQFVSYYSVTITLSSKAKKNQQMGHIFFPEAGKLNVASWSGAELIDGNSYLIPVMAVSSPTGNLAPLREEMLRNGFKK